MKFYKNLESFIWKKKIPLVLISFYLFFILLDALIIKEISSLTIVGISIIWIIISKFLKIKHHYTLVIALILFVLDIIIQFSNNDFLVEKIFSYSFVFCLIYTLQELFFSNYSQKIGR
jgi:hypothetical protein